jgi:hypothetical protein
VGFFDRLEHGLERAVNTAFAKTFKSGVQPVELTAALRREVDTKSSVVARDRILVPNIFTISMSRADYDRMTSMGPTLIDELMRQLTKHAQAQGFQFSGPIQITLENREDLSVGLLAVRSESVTGTVTWSGVLDIDGQRYPLRRGRTVIGRGTDADITVNDSSISRKHIEILWDGSHAQARDLGSTNGSLINGRKLTTAGLESGSTVELGSTRVTFHLAPQAASTS